jgi:hypothetical protein
MIGRLPLTATWRRSRIGVVGAALAGMMFACMLGTPLSASGRVQDKLMASNERCDKDAPTRLPAQRWQAARLRLAPSGANAILVCRYSGMNAHPRLVLVHSLLVRSSSLIAKVVAELDRLPSLRGTVNCPMDDGSEIVLTMYYPTGRTVMISLGLTGCDLVSNGSVARYAGGFGEPPAFGPKLLDQLETLSPLRV